MIFKFTRWNSQVHREFPRNLESSNLSTNKTSTEIASAADADPGAAAGPARRASGWRFGRGPPPAVRFNQYIIEQ